MPRYEVKMTIEFAGEIEAETQEDAERLAIYDDTVFYQGVESIEIEELEDEEEEEDEIA